MRRRMIMANIVNSGGGGRRGRGGTLHFGQPVRLVVVLGGNGEGVEEHQDDDQPVEGHRLHGGATLPAAETVPASPLAAAGTKQFDFKGQVGPFGNGTISSDTDLESKHKQELFVERHVWNQQWIEFCYNFCF